MDVRLLRTSLFSCFLSSRMQTNICISVSLRHKMLTLVTDYREKLGSMIQRSYVFKKQTNRYSQQHE